MWIGHPWLHWHLKIAVEGWWWGAGTVAIMAIAAKGYHMKE